MPHMCHTRGTFTVNGGNSRIKHRPASAYVGPANTGLGLPTFQAGIQTAIKTTGGRGEGDLHPARKYQPSTGPVKGSKILWPRSSRTHATLPRAEPLHGQSILKVLRTRPLTAPAAGSDRRLSGEARHVGGHSYRSDHEPHGSVPGVQRRRPGARPGMHLRREGAHLRSPLCAWAAACRCCVPDRTVIGGQSRSYADTS